MSALCRAFLYRFDFSGGVLGAGVVGVVGVLGAGVELVWQRPAGVAKGVLERCGARFKKVGVEFASTKPTVEVEDLRDGEGPFARSGDTVEMTYEGTLADTGERFDGGKGFTFTIDGGEVIKGWDQGVKGMKLGAKRRLRVPSALGYGKVRIRPCVTPFRSARTDQRDARSAGLPRRYRRTRTSSSSSR